MYVFLLSPLICSAAGISDMDCAFGRSIFIWDLSPFGFVTFPTFLNTAAHFTNRTFLGIAIFARFGDINFLAIWINIESFFYILFFVLNLICFPNWYWHYGLFVYWIHCIGANGLFLAIELVFFLKEFLGSSSVETIHYLFIPELMILYCMKSVKLTDFLLYSPQHLIVFSM